VTSRQALRRASRALDRRFPGAPRHRAGVVLPYGMSTSGHEAENPRPDARLLRCRHQSGHRVLRRGVAHRIRCGDGQGGSPAPASAPDVGHLRRDPRSRGPRPSRAGSAGPLLELRSSNQGLAGAVRIVRRGRPTARPFYQGRCAASPHAAQGHRRDGSRRADQASASRRRSRSGRPAQRQDFDGDSTTQPTGAATGPETGSIRCGSTIVRDFPPPARAAARQGVWVITSCGGFVPSRLE
jgi:hypothetical protein